MRYTGNIIFFSLWGPLVHLGPMGQCPSEPHLNCPVLLHCDILKVKAHKVHNISIFSYDLANLLIQ